MSDLAVNVSTIVAGLRSASWQARQDAFNALQSLTDPAALPLLAAEVSADDDLLINAFCKFMGALKHPACFPYLQAFLDHPAESIRKEAGWAVEKFPEDLRVDFMLRLLESGTRFSRTIAAQKLGELRRERSVLPLIVSLDDHEPAVVAAAIEALRLLGDKRPLERVTALLQHADEKVVLASINLLGELGSGTTWKRLRRFLDVTHSPPVRQAAAWAMGRLGGVSARGPLIRTAFSDPDPAVRCEALKRLTRVPNPRVVRVILDRQVFDADQNVRLVATWQMREIPASFKTRALRGLAHDENPKVRSQAILQLGRAAHPSVVPILLEAFQSDPHQIVRAAAAEALGHARVRTALEALLKGLDDEYIVSYASAVSIATLAGLEDQRFILRIWNDFEEGLPDIVKQVLIRYFRGPAYRKQLLPEARALLLRLKDAPNLNVQYLAVEALGRARDREMLPALIDSWSRATDGGLIEMLHDSFDRILEGDPAPLVDVIDNHRGDPTIARGALRLIGRVRCIPAHELRVGSLLLDRLPVIHDVGIFKEVKEAIVRLLRRSPDTLASYLDKVDATGDEAYASETELLSMLQRIVEERPALMRIEPVARRLASPNANVRYLAAKVLGTAGNPEAVKPLIERTKIETHDDVADSIRASVRKLVLSK